MTTPDTTSAHSALTILGQVVDARDALLQQNSALGLQNTSLVAQLNVLTSNNVALRGQVDTLTAQVAALRAKVSRIVVGTSNDDTRLGYVSVMRTFCTDGLKVPNDPRPQIISFKKFVKADVVAGIQALPRDSHLVFWHEVEDDIEKTNNVTVESWIAGMLATCQAIKDAGRAGEVFPMAILMGWSIENRPDMLKALLTPAVVKALKDGGGTLAFDRYAKTVPPALSKTAPADLYGPCAAYSAALGLPWAITETGMPQNAQTDDAAAAAWWTKAFAFFISGQVELPRFVMGWNPADRMDGVYDLGRYPKVAGVWKQALAAYPYKR